MPAMADESSHQADVETQNVSDQTNLELRKSKIITIFLACSTVDLVALIDQTTLAASLYVISRNLSAGEQSSWIASSYFLTSTSFQLLYGHLSDIWSRKAILLGCMVIFFFGSLASSLSQTAVQLIVFRAFTGVGGGGLMTLAQTIVSDVVSLRERGKYQGILGAVVAISNAIGPVIGASLSGISPESWRWIFRLNLPLTVISALAVILFMPLKRVEGHWRNKIRAGDYFGSFLTLTGSALIVLGLSWAGFQYPWSSSNVIAPIVVGILTCGAFVLWEWKGAKLPVMPLRIFQKRIVAGACLTTFINGWLFVTQIYYIPSFFQLARNYSPLISGLLLLPITITQTFASTFSGLIINWTGRYREVLLLGWVAWAIGLGLYSTLHEDSPNPVAKSIGFGILTGVGVGFTLQPALIAIQAGVIRTDMAAVTCMRSFVRNLGSTLGLAVAGTVINNSVRSNLLAMSFDNSEIQTLINNPQYALDALPAAERSRVRAAAATAYSLGFKRVFYSGAALAGAACVLAAFLIPQLELEGSRSKSEVESEASAEKEEAKLAAC